MGWKWEGGHFVYKHEFYEMDLKSGISDQARTTTEFVKAMSSLVEFLEFEGEESGMFENQKLPTLDTEIWWNGREIMYNFFEKPMCPNTVVQKDSALSENCIRATLVQEGVRRLLNCSKNLEKSEKQEILSKFAQKMYNSKHSIESIKFVLVHVIGRFDEILRNASLPENHKDFQPVHFDKDFRKYERKLRKFLALTTWYSDDLKKKKSWRSDLPPEWRGSKPIQKKVPEIEYTTVLQCPSSRNGRLIRALARIEPRLTRTTGYQVRLSERGGRPLAKMFNTNLGDGKCHRSDCPICNEPDTKGPTLCQVKNIVYEAVCKICDSDHKKAPNSKHQGKYRGIL